MGAGRPKTLGEGVKKAFWLDAEVYERAKAAAERKGVTLSEVVRDSIARLAGTKPKRRKRRS